MVSYSVFIPISEDESSYGKITGTVIGRSIEYSIDGLETELTVAPGVADMETYVGDAEITEFTKTFGDEEDE
jgi:glutamate mutase epsilon subunit